MKYKLAIVLAAILFINKTEAQYFALSGQEKYILFQQPDSLYKVNKVRTRSVYSIDKANNKKTFLYKLRMDKEGRILSLEYPLTKTGQTQITSFTYTTQNKLAAINEVVIKGTPETFIKEIPGKGFNHSGKKLSLVPRRQQFNYLLQDSAGYLQSISRFNDTGKIISQSVFESNGLINTFRIFTKDNFTCITHYEANKQFSYLPVSDAWKNGKGNLTQKRFQYTPGERGFINKMVEYDIQQKVMLKKNEYTLKYLANGLLEKLSSGHLTYMYEYEFYD